MAHSAAGRERCCIVAGQQARAAVGATLRIRGHRLRAYAVHLGSPLGISGGSRRAQLQVVLDDAERCADRVIVAGDFNSLGIGEHLTRARFA